MDAMAVADIEHAVGERFDLGVQRVHPADPTGRPVRRHLISRTAGQHRAAGLASATYGAAMSAADAMRTARWRRWLSSVPVIVALLFATTTLASTVTADADPPATSAHLLAVQFRADSAQLAAGQRPDIPIVKRAGSWSPVAGAGALAWLPARAGAVPIGWWHRRQDVTGRRAEARHETYRGRGPPGRRTPHALS
jgi:hypothetical protein